MHRERRAEHAGVAYTLEIEGIEPLIDLDFDRLYAQGVRGEWNSVRIRCHELLAATPTCVWPHLLLGYAELSEKKLELAYTHFHEGIRLPQPLGSEACAGAGRSLVGLGRVHEAISLLHEHVNRCPECHFTWHALGVAIAALGDYEHAWLCAQRATELCPTHTESVWLLVSAGSALGRHSELIVSLEGVQRAQPWNLDVRGARALSLLREGRRTEALDEMTRVLSFAPFIKTSPDVLEMIRQSMSTAYTGEA